MVMVPCHLHHCHHHLVHRCCCHHRQEDPHLEGLSLEDLSLEDLLFLDICLEEDLLLHHGVHPRNDGQLCPLHHYLVVWDLEFFCQEQRHSLTPFDGVLWLLIDFHIGGGLYLSFIQIDMPDSLAY